MTTVYLNGEYLPLSEAKISVMDRGFLFGDAVYEVIPVYGKTPFRLEQHLDRLHNSLAGIRMENPLSHDQWADILQQIIEQNEGNEQSIYLQVTRGAYEKRDHAIPQDVKPTIFVMSTPLLTPSPEDREKGVAAITLDDIRWDLCNIKATALLGNVLSRAQAKQEDAYEALLVRDGKVLEGAASNLFIIMDELLITPPKNNCVLPGVTRDLILELATEAGIPWCEADINIVDLQMADEIWVTSSTKEILPVTQLNGKPVGDGKAGSHWHFMASLYSTYIARLKFQPE